ncbi:hypothetical protein HMPREF3196_00482 [Bifidobacterium bifidum]|uniref:Uncharacterized protein n=1 Tax=Bifidobacterium bifidum TaxID=1681 RepID=A0A133KS70_BIFBI|nr:hypothetical protein HMPREF3196_00482 [Bifidobacterium bifidum]
MPCSFAMAFLFNHSHQHRHHETRPACTGRDRTNRKTPPGTQ